MRLILKSMAGAVCEQENTASTGEFHSIYSRVSSRLPSGRIESRGLSTILLLRSVLNPVGIYEQ